MTHYMFQSNASTTAVRNHEYYLMHLRIKTNIPKQSNKVHPGHYYSQSVVNQQPQHQVHRAFSAMTVPISLSLSTPVPKLPGKTKLLQASVSRSPVQKSVKPHCSCTLPNLKCSTTHVLFPDYTNFSSHTCGNPILSHEPRSLTKQKSDPPGSHATVSLSYYHLQA